MVRTKRQILRRQRRRIPIKRKSLKLSKVKATTTGNPIVKAVRSVLSYLPGQAVVGPLADLAFKIFGVTSSVPKTAGTYNAVNIVGCYAAVNITVGDLIAFSENSTRSESGEIYKGASAKTKIQTVKMLALAISIRNTTPLGTKEGNWAAYFRPIKSSKTKSDRTIYTYKNIVELVGAKNATAREDIVLNINRFPTYWLCGRELAIADVIGILYIGFEDLNRIAYTDLTSKEFSCSATISSEMLILENLPGNGLATFDYDLDDKYSYYTHHLVVGSRSTNCQTTYLTDVKCTNNDTNCTIVGKPTSLEEEFEVMKLE